jgi:predicted component of type VI protein secretion system
MTIKFSIVEPQDLLADQIPMISFDTQGGKIGNETANDWILLDDFVSRKHATIQYKNDAYYIIDHSSNGTSLLSMGNPEPQFFQNEEHQLNNGDILYIGDYDIQVNIEDDILEPLKPKAKPKPTNNDDYIKPIPKVSTNRSIQEQDYDIVHAFLEGAGLDLPIEKLDPDLMRNLGQAFRETIEGLIKLVEVRKKFKFANDIEETRFHGRVNNPLKVIQDPNMAIEIMLLQRKGYLPMLDAIQEGFENVEAHLLAMGAGIMGGLDNTMKLFSPQKIENMVAQQNKLFNSDGSKWKQFVKLHNELEINDLLSKALAEAYEEQIERLNKRRNY